MLSIIVLMDKFTATYLCSEVHTSGFDTRVQIKMNGRLSYLDNLFSNYVLLVFDLTFQLERHKRMGQKVIKSPSYIRN